MPGMITLVLAAAAGDVESARRLGEICQCRPTETTTLQ